MTTKITNIYSPQDSLNGIYEYLVDIVGVSSWIQRKENIEAGLRKNLQRFIPLLSRNDIPGWYLLQLENYLHNQIEYEIFQGSRIISFFEQLSIHLQDIKRINWAEDKFIKMMSINNKHPDSELFELSIASLYQRNNCDVSFIQESHHKKTPDLLIAHNGIEWNSECKRMAKITDYSFDEREAWTKIWSKISPILIKLHPNEIFEIDFKIELVGSDVAFVAQSIIEAIINKISYHALFSINWITIDLSRVNSALDEDVIPAASPALYSLISKDFNVGWGFTYIASGDQRNIRNDPEFSLGEVMFKIDKIAAAKWKVSNLRSIEKKAKGVRKRLDDAIKQSNDKALSVHIGIELVEDECIGLKRIEKFNNEIMNFDSLGTDLREIFCHTFKPDPHIDGSPDVQEDVYHFEKDGFTSTLDHIGIFS